MQYDFVIVDVFTDTPFGGNQLAVLPEANGLTSAQMQSIAREFNFAESTFVLPPDDRSNTARVRIFSPLTEMPFAGHPTVGTAAALVLRGLVPVREDGGADLVFEEGVGPVRVTVTDGERGLRSELALDGDLTQPPYAPEATALAEALSLPPARFVAPGSPAWASRSASVTSQPRRMWTPRSSTRPHGPSRSATPGRRICSSSPAS